MSLYSNRTLLLLATVESMHCRISFILSFSNVPSVINSLVRVLSIACTVMLWSLCYCREYSKESSQQEAARWCMISA